MSATISCLSTARECPVCSVSFVPLLEEPVCSIECAIAEALPNARIGDRCTFCDAYVGDGSGVCADCPSYSR